MWTMMMTTIHNNDDDDELYLCDSLHRDCSWSGAAIIGCTCCVLLLIGGVILTTTKVRRSILIMLLYLWRWYLSDRYHVMSLIVDVKWHEMSNWATGRDTRLRCSFENTWWRFGAQLNGGVMTPRLTATKCFHCSAVQMIREMSEMFLCFLIKVRIGARCQVKYCKYWFPLPDIDVNVYHLLLYCPLFSKESYSSLERMFSLRLQFRQSSLLSLKLYLKGEIGNFTNTPRSFPVKGNNISICKRILIVSCFSIKDSIWQCWLVTAVKLWSIICRTWFTVLLHHMRRTSVTLRQCK